MPNVPLSEIPSFIAAALNEHDNELAAEKERQEAFPIFAAACERAGIEVKPGDFETVSAADLRTLTDDMSNFSYPEESLFATGAYDSQKKEWER